MNALTEITGEEVPGFGFDLDALSTVARWRDDLRYRIGVTLLVFELHDCEIDFQPLADEVAAFVRVVKCLTWRSE